MRIRTYHEITADEVGKTTLRMFGKDRRVTDFMDKIQESDIGKRIFHDWSTDLLSVENDTQLKARLKGYGGRA